MNDSGRAKSSAIVLAERKPHRANGCAGIFSQLFEWNRKLAKKLLFSKKVLPPARSKQAYKKFGGHEKLPRAKLLLIADENSGGFPSAKKNGFRDFEDEKRLQKHEMRSPSLVARLMGLESMPVKNQTHCDRDEKFVGELSKSNKQVCSSEKKKSSKTESRPQKIQKTGVSERHGMTRFGADALQFKGVLTRPRKHHTKLASPLKSPRSISARSASRFIGAAATKILEPGLQAKNRTRYALTYSNYMHQKLNNEVAMEENPFRSPEPSKQFGYDGIGPKPLKEQPSSCKTCGGPLDEMEFRQNMKEERSSSSCFPSQGSECGSREAPAFSIEEKLSVGCEPVALVAQAKDSPQEHGEEQTTDRKPPSPRGLTEWNLASQNCKPHQDVSFPSASNYKTRNQIAINKDRAPARLNLSNIQNRRVSQAANAAGAGNKDFVALNRSSSSLKNRKVSPAANAGGGPKDVINGSQGARARLRMPINGDSCKLETERKSYHKQDSSFSVVRTQKRTRNIGRKVANTSPTSSTCGNLSSSRCELVNRKGLENNAGSVDGGSLKRRLANQRAGSSSTVRSSDGKAFMFSSPLRHGAASSKMDEYQDNNNSQQKRLILNENDINMPFLKLLQRRGDDLGAFLEQKLKELSHQEEDQSNRSTAMILQELISVLSKERPISSEDGMVDIDQKENSGRGIQELSDHTFFHNEDVCQAEGEMNGISNRFPDNVCHLSPGSVLEASFSNDSCFSSNSSAVGLHPEPMDYSTNQPEPDSDASDSATSLTIKAASIHVVAHLINQISRRICNIGAGLTGHKLNYTKEVILKAELLLSEQKSDVTKDFLLRPLMLDKLEALTSVTNSAFFLSFDRTKEVNQLRAFLLDCAIEYLDSKYVSHYKLGYTTWRRFQLSQREEMLVREVDQEIRRWAQFAGKLPDEIIDSEMSHCLGKWTDFEIEAFEIGAQIGGDILLNLVDEIAVDLCQCGLDIF